MNDFKTMEESSITARSNRLAKANVMYGVKYLDLATGGIRKNDLIIIGGRSGCGKTELASHIALANVLQDRTVHYLALEAEQDEIYNRLLYKIIKKLYYNDGNKEPFLYRDWMNGSYDLMLRKYNTEANNIISKKYNKLNVFYRRETEFGALEMQILINSISVETDLIIIDHLHYIDLESEKENIAMKQLVKTIRDLALVNGKPIILIAHLRKKSFQDKSLVPDLEEFHGSSDITKIATQVITLSANGSNSNSEYNTLFKVCKCRVDGSAMRYIGQQVFDIKINDYADSYTVARAEDCTKEFTPITNEIDLPLWGKDSKIYVPTKSLYARDKTSTASKFRNYTETDSDIVEVETGFL